MHEERTRFIQHRGKRIYLIDIEGLTPAEVVAHVIPRVARDVRAEPPASVVTCLHVKGVKLEPAMNEKLRDLAAGNAPYVKASAIAALSPLQRVVVNMIRLFTRREFHTFATKEEALDFLASLP